LPNYKLELKNLTVTALPAKKILVKNVSLGVAEEGVTAILGQSGSGKTTICLSVLGLLPQGLDITGEILLRRGKSSLDILRMKEGELHELRGKKVAITFQEPRRYMNPIIKCGEQLMDLVDGSRKEKLQKAIELLETVRFERPMVIFNKYPFELSGGQAQKFSLALALSKKPAILLADEPTTGLDYESKKDLAMIYNDQIEKNGLSIFLVTHDVYFAHRIADFVGVIFNGYLLEFGSKKEIFSDPFHPYTKQLIEATSLDRLFSMGNELWDYNFSLRSDGCIFSRSCKYSMPECFKNEPPEYRTEERMVRCFLFSRG